MDFVGFFNWGGSGTEIVTGGSNEQLPSAEQNVGTNEYMFFSGDFTNLSREMVHVSLFGFQQGGISPLHRHDLRPYETLQVTNIPLQRVALFVPANKLVGFHGMGVLRQASDEDERTLMLSKATLGEALHQSPDFLPNKFKNTTITTATTTTLWTPTASSTIGVYKITVSCAGANTVELEFTNSAGASADKIGLLRFASEGTFVYDFDTALMRNPNGNDGLMRAITSTTASTQIDCIGHDILYSQ